MPFLVFFSLTCLDAQGDGDTPPGEPEVSSIFPQTGQRGTTLRAEIRGKNLEGAYALWWETGGFRAAIKNVEEITPEKKEGTPQEQTEAPEPHPGHRVSLEMDAHTSIGNHRLRIVTPAGVSNALDFFVTDELVLAEGEASHDRPHQAQMVRFPVVVNGRIEKGGEVDYYAFEARKGQELTFEVMGTGFDPHLALYEPTGSWFDPGQVTRLAFNDERRSRLSDPSPQLTYRFPGDGRYLLKVGSFLARGGPDAVYRLRIAALQWGAGEMGSPPGSGWREHTFTRSIGQKRLQELRSRTITAVQQKREEQRETSTAGGPAPVLIDPGVALVPRKEEEPNDTPDHAQTVLAPVAIEGAIHSRGDIDAFQFSVKAGAKLAFEIEVLQSEPPFFNPRMELLDAQGRRLWRKIEDRIRPKAEYTFEREGEYILQIEDLSSRYDPSFLYRLLIRPQIPHVGEIRIQEDRINLPTGQARNLTVTVEQEEGFRGEPWS